MDYTILFSHGFRARLKSIENIYIETVKDKMWAGFDLSDQPYSLCIRDKQKSFILYSTLLYQFKTHQEAKLFVENIFRENALNWLIQELQQNKEKLNKVLKPRVEKESAPFKEALQEAGIQFQSFYLLYTHYNDLTPPIRKYFREKGLKVFS